MVIKLPPPKKKDQGPNTFTPDDVDWLFSQNKDWAKFYDENGRKLKEVTIDVYKWCVFPLHIKEGKFYRCILHPTVEVKMGPDFPPKLVVFENINYAEFISHCIYYKPEEHKQYIIEKLFGSHDRGNTSGGSTVSNS